MKFNLKLAIPAAILVLAFLAGGGYMLYQNQQNQVKADPQKSAQDEVKKVIDIAPVNIGTASAQTLPKVALRNGTKTSGLTARIENQLKKENLQFDVSSKENAGKQDYKKTVVVVLNESSKELAKSIANLLDATIGDLPDGESKPAGVDIMVILGKDAI